jgi:hypothetical protein
VRNVWYRNVRIFVGYYDVSKGGGRGLLELSSINKVI